MLTMAYAFFAQHIGTGKESQGFIPQTMEASGKGLCIRRVLFLRKSGYHDIDGKLRNLVNF